MSTTRDLWLETRPVIRTRKINKTLTIPSFSVACGSSRGSVELRSNVSPLRATGLALVATNGLTFEFWMKLFKESTQSSYTVALIEDESNGRGVSISVSSADVMTVTIVTSLNTYSFTVSNFGYYTWNRYTVTFSTVENKCILYRDGLAVGNVTTTGVLGSSTHKVIFGNSLVVSYFNGYVSEVTVHNTRKTYAEVIQQGDFPKSFNSDSSIKYHWKLNGTSAPITGAGSLASNASTTAFVTNEFAPIRYGASFAAYVATVTVDKKCSLQFPVVAQENANHGMFVSWLDEGTGLTQRRKLYEPDPSVGNLDVVPDYDVYNGEKLPTLFQLEFWNIDGDEFVTLTNDLIITLSITSQPTSGIDHTPLMAAVPSGTSDLAAPFPWTFPVTFNQPITYP